jgi:hypothetical protein
MVTASRPAPALSGCKPIAATPRDTHEAPPSNPTTPLSPSDLNGGNGDVFRNERGG